MSEKEQSNGIGGFSETLFRKKHEYELQAFDKLVDIQDKNKWKDPDFYEGAPELKKLMKGDFENFVTSQFGIDKWKIFELIKEITKIPNWRELYKRYGYDELNNLLLRPADVQKTILKAINDGDKRSIYRIIQEYYPDVK